MARFEENMGETEAGAVQPHGAHVAPKANVIGPAIEALNNIGAAYSAQEQNQAAADFMAGGPSMEPFSESLAQSLPQVTGVGSAAELRSSFVQDQLSSDRAGLRMIQEAVAMGELTSAEAAIMARAKFNDVTSNPLSSIYGDQLADEFRGLSGGGNGTWSQMFPKTQAELVAEAQVEGQLEAQKAYSQQVEALTLAGYPPASAEAHVRASQRDDATLQRLEAQSQIRNLTTEESNLRFSTTVGQNRRRIGEYRLMMQSAEDVETGRRLIGDMRQNELRLISERTDISPSARADLIKQTHDYYDAQVTTFENETVRASTVRATEAIEANTDFIAAQVVEALNQSTGYYFAILDEIGGPDAQAHAVSMYQSILGRGGQGDAWNLGLAGIDQAKVEGLRDVIDAITAGRPIPNAVMNDGAGAVVSTEEMGAIAASSPEALERVAEMASQVPLDAIQLANFESWHRALQTMPFAEQSEMLQTTAARVRATNPQFNFARPLGVRQVGGNLSGWLGSTEKTGRYNPSLTGTAWEFVDLDTGETVGVPDDMAQLLIGAHELARKSGEFEHENVPLAAWAVVTGTGLESIPAIAQDRTEQPVPQQATPETQARAANTFEEGLGVETPEMAQTLNPREQEPAQVEPQEREAELQTNLDERYSEYPELVRYITESIVPREGGLNGAISPANAAGLFQMTEVAWRDLNTLGADLPEKWKGKEWSEIRDEFATSPIRDQLDVFESYIDRWGFSLEQVNEHPELIGLLQGGPGYARRIARDMEAGKTYEESLEARKDTVVYEAGSEAARKNPAWQEEDGKVTIGSMVDYYRLEEAPAASPDRSAVLDRLTDRADDEEITLSTGRVITVAEARRLLGADQ